MKRRILSLFCVLALCLGLLPSAAFAAGTDTGKAIQLVDSGIAANIGGGQADNLYFGTYQQSSDGNDGYNIDPIKWRVLENAGGHLFLLSDQNLDVFQYHTDWEEITWERSTMRSWLNGYGASENAGGDSGTDYTSDNFIGAAFSEKEQKAIAETTVVNNDNPNHNTDGGNNTTDKIFLLSIAEANNGSYFADDSSRISTNTAYVADGGKIGGDMFSAGKGDWWWLRSPGSDDHSAAGVAGNGDVDNAGVHGDDEDRAVRPAFHLDLNSVLFTSAAVGGKAGDGLNAVANYDGNEWKLTLLDNSRNFSISDAKTNGSGDTIVFSYSDAQTGTNEYISIVIEDNGAITYYGRILQLDGTTNGSSGTTSLTLPDGVTLGDTTKLYVFNEQYNGDKMTDYASQLKEISSPTVDTTAPTLSNGSATRTGETTATVKFTSDEAGSYYYVVDNNATAPDSIDTTTTAGTSCKANEETEISLDSLSGEYIHIVVKDAANNVSDILTIQIPAYTFTVTVNVDPSEGGAASASPTTAAPNTEITLTATPKTGYHFKKWEVTEGTASIGNDDKFTMPASNVTVKAVFEAHSFTQENTDTEYLVSPATCTQAATYYYSCSCGAKGTGTFTSGEALGHTPEADWKYNDSNHWKECVSCGAKVDEAAHVYDNEQDITCDLCGYVKPTYAISASPGTLDFGSEAEGYADAPAAQIVTITNIGNQSVTVNLPTSTKYIITAGTGFENGTATLALDGTATFTVQPKTGLAIGSHSETLNISGSDGTSASVKLSFTVNAVYTLTVNLNGGSGNTTGGQYPAGKVVNIDAGSRSSYRFTGWTASNGGSFADASSASTTFTMPAADTTITANWTYSGGGGSSRPSTPSTPTGPSTGTSDGWEDIREEIADADRGDTIAIDMNGETEVPAEIFEEVAGKDVTVEFELEDGISWTVNGQDVPEDTRFADLDLGVDMGTSGITVDVINTVTGELGSVQITLAHDGEFGFALTLTAPLGRENAGYWANLYHYDEDAKTLNYETSAQINDQGDVSLRMTHASQYAIVIDDKNHALPFADLGENQWYESAVRYAYTHDIMEGMSATKFSPNISLTRAQAVQVLYNLEGQPTVSESTTFPDLVYQWYKPAISWAESTGVVDGYEDGTFRPGQPVNRMEFAQMLYNYAKYKGYDLTAQGDLTAFPDGDSVQPWAETAMTWANGNALINGHDDGTLEPGGTTTRAQAASILMRFDQNVLEN